VIGGWDGKVRVMESEGWRCIGLMNWGSRINDKSVVSSWRRQGRHAETAGRVERTQ
jgi:hypothetical protein